MTCEESEFDWCLLVPYLIHPLRVAIIEAIAYVSQPLSATELHRLFGDDELQLALISYHVKQLRKAGALVKVRERQSRGSVEKFYVLQSR
jgi:DNA-binding transcriptional ArsR family regulator